MVALTHRRRRPRRCVPIQQQRHGGRCQQPHSQLQHPAPRCHRAPAPGSPARRRAAPPGSAAGFSTSASRPTSSACRAARAARLWLAWRTDASAGRWWTLPPFFWRFYLARLWDPPEASRPPSPWPGSCQRL